MNNVVPLPDFKFSEEYKADCLENIHQCANELAAKNVQPLASELLFCHKDLSKECKWAVARSFFYFASNDTESTCRQTLLEKCSKEVIKNSSATISHVAFGIICGVLASVGVYFIRRSYQPSSLESIKLLDLPK